MRRTFLVGLLLMTPVAASAQATDTPRTPWDAPDLSGYWEYRSTTPLERPAAGAILARGLLSDAVVGYSASLEFLDPGNAKSARFHGAGLRLGDVGGRRWPPPLSPTRRAWSPQRSPAGCGSRRPTGPAHPA